jgi:glycosyltransferase involved in cell wall biosynthesis
MKPLVSILIPAFNAEEWIAETLRSARAQTWQRKEIIVVDDGSADQTLTVARRFESDVVRVVIQKHEGAASARNKALSLSRGDYIQWLDADDLLSANKIASQIEALGECARKRILLSSAWAHFMYRSYRARFVPTALWSDLSAIEWLLRKMGQNLYMQTATWLVSRELTAAAGPWDTTLLGDDDGEYFCRVLLASAGTRFVSDARVYYRVPGPKNLSYIGRSDRKLQAHWRSMCLHITYLRSLEDSQRVRAACLNYLQNWLPIFCPERLDIVAQAAQMANDLGGQLELPRIAWKCSRSYALCGQRLMKRGREFLLRFRHAAARHWDKALFDLERRSCMGDFGVFDESTP